MELVFSAHGKKGKSVQGRSSRFEPGGSCYSHRKTQSADQSHRRGGGHLWHTPEPSPGLRPPSPIRWERDGVRVFSLSLSPRHFHRQAGRAQRGPTVPFTFSPRPPHLSPQLLPSC